MSKNKRRMDRHHRKPTSIGGTSDTRNISVIARNKHEAWHILFNNMVATEIAREVNEKYLDPDYILLPIFIGDKDKAEILTIIRKATKALDY